MQDRDVNEVIEYLWKGIRGPKHLPKEGVLLERAWRAYRAGRISSREYLLVSERVEGVLRARKEYALHGTYQPPE
jgi:hypothetical protein